MMEKETYLSDNYTSIYKKLRKTTNLFLVNKNKDELKSFILKQRNPNEDRLKNSLIEIPLDDIKSFLGRNYVKINYLEGNLGTVDATDQFDGITNMALLMLMSNRVAKGYRSNNDSHLTEEQQSIYKKNESTLLRWKDMAMKDLIASLYVFNKTESDYKDFFSYGYRKDKKGNDSFVIDLPYFGQFCVHFGHKMQSIVKNAKETAIGILENKQELGQISQEELKSFVQELNDTTILPNYTGKLYEYIAGLPIEYEGPKVKSIKKSLGLDKKLPEDIRQEDLLKIRQSGLNARETYYFAIKLGLSKQQLEQVVEINRNYLSGKKIGRSALQSTNAEERASVARQEHNRQNVLDNHTLNQ